MDVFERFGGKNQSTVTPKSYCLQSCRRTAALQTVALQQLCQIGERRVKIDEGKAVEKGHRNFPLGITKIEGGIHISVAAPGKECSLRLYEKGKILDIPFAEDSRVGSVWSMDLLAEQLDGLEYTLIVDGKEVSDQYGRAFTERELWGDLKRAGKIARSRFVVGEFDWEDDRPLQIPYEESIIYRLHVRGFTKHSSSHVKNRGSFDGIREKIPYLKGLGVTALELLPPNEFDEVMMPDQTDGNPYKSGEPTGRLNYWGYTPGFYFAPKAAYTSRGGTPETELKALVKELHKNGLEIIIELYFTGKESPSAVLDAVRFWVQEYHVDGVHLVGGADGRILADDPYLSATKLFAACWNCAFSQKKRHLGEYNDGFLIDMRRLLKGDEDQMNQLIYRSKRNPREYGVINYMAHTNGFTMMDMVSYEMKHNEANGEDNQDGSAYNYTWNCGVEGPTRKKKIVDMRKKQIKNAWLLLLLSQGTPLILSGDEFGNTKKGNNNSYCQDNEISWLDWNFLNTHRDIYEFVKYAIAFRKKHPVFHMEAEPRVMDYLVCGHPDVSYHGVKAWCPEFDHFRRQLGIMYCGEYGKKPDGSQDDYFFIAYNMHWEPHEFALPKLPKGMQWHVAFNTDEKERNGIYQEGEEVLLKEQKKFMVSDRSIVVFRGIRTEEKSNPIQASRGSCPSGKRVSSR